MSQPRQTTFDVQGMTCGSCVRHVRDAVTALDGVVDVDVLLRAGTVVVHHDAGRAPSDRVAAALDDAGYPARPRRVDGV
ncbi:MAG: heavy-metal-associated domain-containing protein [Kofleriaceae bacterium]|nr:heavy-metal-associated domain-containing protein [Myxococcales bacterium]MCB9561625.1 heavy-metal-associated domain-containing protein [Kofleriaceae bacterium]